MTVHYKVPDNKKKRIIMDTDAACEADDPFAIAHGLMCQMFDIKGIVAEHFTLPGSMEKSYQAILKVLETMDKSVPVYKGEPGALSEAIPEKISEGAEMIIEEAMTVSDRPLFVLCLGAITNVASAIRQAPEIAKKMTVVWIGGQNPDNPVADHREFNAGNDIYAINLVVSSGVEFWQIPNNVYGTMHIGIAEIERRIRPCGAIGRHLFDQLNTYNQSEMAGWTAGESWSLGDSPAIGVALEPNCGSFYYRQAPIFLDDTSYAFPGDRPMIRVYRTINSRFIIEDLICKLDLYYGSLLG